MATYSEKVRVIIKSLDKVDQSAEDFLTVLEEHIKELELQNLQDQPAFRNSHSVARIMQAQLLELLTELHG